LSIQAVHNERELLRQIAQGDEQAFNTLFGLYREKLYYYLLKITKSAEISEELVIDIFLKLWLGRELTSKIEHPESFFYKVAYHKAVDFLKVTSRHARLQQVYIDRAQTETQSRIDDVIVDAELRKLVYDAVNSLPPQRKLIYTLSREEGLSHQQIAEALNLSRNTVKNSMMSATRSIGEFLRKAHAEKVAFSMLFFLY
jgi:RNA polymerase sigma-70 factor (family 1)